MTLFDPAAAAAAAAVTISNKLLPWHNHASYAKPRQGNMQAWQHAALPNSTINAHLSALEHQSNSIMPANDLLKRETEIHVKSSKAEKKFHAPEAAKRLKKIYGRRVAKELTVLKVAPAQDLQQAQNMLHHPL